MSIGNFFKNLFNGSVFTTDIVELKERCSSAERLHVDAAGRANSLENSNMIYKSDRQRLERDLATTTTDLEKARAQIESLSDAVKEARAAATQEINRLSVKIVELEKNQRPPRVNGKFVSTKAATKVAKTETSPAKKKGSKKYPQSAV